MRLTIQLTSPPDREKIVAEIWHGDQQWAEVSWEADKPVLQMYPKPSSESEEFWVFELDETLKILSEARNRLESSSSTTE